jgi:GNAT superfamily N-acetyltransferase
MQSTQIIPFTAELQPYFESINKAWVTQYFTLEPFDIEQLEHPEKTIISKGGAILFAKMDEEVIGTVGLIPINESTCEMIKMGVAPSAQEKGVGFQLGIAILDMAKEMGFSKMVLYSNTRLAAALHLYQKLGFGKAEMECGAYGRCDIKMERML